MYFCPKNTRMGWNHQAGHRLRRNQITPTQHSLQLVDFVRTVGVETTLNGLKSIFGFLPVDEPCRVGDMLDVNLVNISLRGGQGVQEMKKHHIGWDL